MKNYFVNRSLLLVSKYNDYSSVKMDEIRYGLESIYLMISKTIILLITAWYLNIMKEFIIFTLIYNLIRMPSFGMHATKSWICLLSSFLIFIIIPIICKYIVINFYIKFFVFFLCAILIYKNAPADTHKKPIINLKRRRFYKITSTVISIIFSILSLTIYDNFLSNCLLLSIVIQNFMISPYVYQWFGLPYNNYLKYTVTKD